LRLKNTIIDTTLTYASETWAFSKRDRQHLNIFGKKVYRRILGPVYDSEKELITQSQIFPFHTELHSLGDSFFIQLILF
jgi:hypothetical protein